MNQLHQYLTLDHARAGMVLADEVLDKQGHVLLPAGTTLTKQLIHSLENHGIQQVSITVTQSEEQIQQEQAYHQKKLDRLATIFRHCPDNPASLELRSCIEKYRQAEAI